VDQAIFLVTLIIIVVTATLLAVWMRRDRGAVPEDSLPQALQEPLDGHSDTPA
jgi:hypothetical protein